MGFVALGAPPDESAIHASEEFFEKSIRPLFVGKCFACHTDSKLGGLRLDSRESILAGGKSGPAIQPGKPGDSLLIQAVSHTHDRLKMPPSGRLDAKEVSLLTAWVKAGAVWPMRVAAPAPASPDRPIPPERRAFWAFRAIRKPAPPQVKDTRWPLNAIDRFVLAKLEEKRLTPVGPAAKTALLRRATFDLTGLPPTIEEIDAFTRDDSADAFERVVSRLLDSPRYGERWARYWLDLARYADGRLGASRDTPYENSFRYRDWVVRAFNDDLPYDRFVKAQLAADQLPAAEKAPLLPGLGFLALGDDAHERLDVTTKTFLGLTVGCARCHDHKYDPVSIKDYYSLYGVFSSTKDAEVPLAGAAEVEAYQSVKKKIDDLQEKIDDFIKERSTELGEMLAHETSRYLMAAWDRQTGAHSVPEGLDPEILERWIAYLDKSKKDHTFLDRWHALTKRGPDAVSRDEAQRVAHDFQTLAVSLFAEKSEIDDRNYVKLGGAKGAKDERTRQFTNLESLAIEKYYLWRDLASDPFQRNGVYFPGGVYYYGFTNALRRDFEVRGGAVPVVKDIDRFLSGPWKRHLDLMRSELDSLRKALPPRYPFLQVVEDADKPANAKIHLRGDENNLGEEAPRRFLPVLCEGNPTPLAQGSGRLGLAESIAAHPLAARVMANRVWLWHFGQGIVASASNFGELGDRPTHPELLEYLAARLTENGWSLKKLHKEIMLSRTYALGARHSAENAAADPEGRLLWRAKLHQRLDAEALRDTLLFVAGNLAMDAGGVPSELDDKNNRRTIYGYIGRTTPDSMLSLFDFPNPNNTSEGRSLTLGPMQRLYFMNNEFVARQAGSFAERIARAASGEDERIRYAYRVAFGRPPLDGEIKLGKEFLRASGGAWAQYAQALMTSAEFVSIN